MESEPNNPFVTSGLDAVKFVLVRKIEDIDDEDKYFKPDMCHQVFGDSENIFGYKNLTITIMYNASTFQCYLKDHYEEKVKMDSDSVLKPENYKDLIQEWLPENLIPSFESFRETFSPTNMLRPFGKLFDQFTLSGKTYEIFTCTNEEPGYGEFHNRMQTIIVWFIDAANYVTVEDDKWRYLILYEKVVTDGTATYFPVGYTTIYEYYAFPDKRRYRISQFIIFPPYQNQGLGTKFLRIVYKYIVTLPVIKDFTVEDPSEKFQSIRDFVDAKLCLNIPNMREYIKERSFSKMAETVEKIYKLNSKQCRRMYELLMLYYMNEKNPFQFKEYEKIVKRRLNIPFKRAEHINKRLNNMEKEERERNIKIIDKHFDDLLSQYQPIIERLRCSNNDSEYKCFF